MRRGEFLKEMAGSLFCSAKSVYEPFLHDDLEKMEAAADRALGIRWHPLTNEHECAEYLQLKFISGKPVIVTQNGTNMQAYDGVCPTCSNIIILTALYTTGKCLNCQKEFNFNTQSGDLQLKSYPLRRRDHMYFIGFQKQRKLGDGYA